VWQFSSCEEALSTEKILVASHFHCFCITTSLSFLPPLPSRWCGRPSSNAVRASLNDTPLRHPHRPPPPSLSPSVRGGGARGGRRTARRTDDDSGVPFVTVLAVVAVVVSASPPPSPCDRPPAVANPAWTRLFKTRWRENCEKKEVRILFFDSDYLHFFLLLR
jgi:hypothetical protein